MAKDSIRKRCVDCRRVMGGTKGKAQWCEDCGGEMREVVYRRPRARDRKR